MKITLFTGKTFDIREALGFDIKIVKSSRARRMTLRIDSKERLPVLTIPERCAAKRAVDFVNLHRGWIERSLARLPQTKNFEDGEQISLFGRYSPDKRPSLRHFSGKRFSERFRRR